MMNINILKIKLEQNLQNLIIISFLPFFVQTYFLGVRESQLIGTHKFYYFRTRSFKDVYYYFT